MLIWRDSRTRACRRPSQDDDKIKLESAPKDYKLDLAAAAAARAAAAAPAE